MAMQKILIDCDPGIDDAAALLLALCGGMLDVVAITAVSGNFTADQCSLNIRRVLELSRRTDVPVARGPQAPLERPFPDDPFSHGSDGLADLGLPEPTLAEDPRSAARMIVDMVNAYPGELIILGLGPLTNLALALRLDPELPRKVRRLIIIGGCYGVTDHAWTRATGDNPVSEWNIYVDPEAARLVFDARFALLALGIDVTTGDAVAFSAAQQARLAASPRPTARFLAGTTRFVEQRGFGPYCAVIDVLAVAVAIAPDLVETTWLHVGIETQGDMTRGQTVVDRRENFRWTHLPRIEVAVSIDAARALDMLLDAVTRPQN